MADYQIPHGAPGAHFERQSLLALTTADQLSISASSIAAGEQHHEDFDRQALGLHQSISLSDVHGIWFLYLAQGLFSPDTSHDIDSAIDPLQERSGRTDKRWFACVFDQAAWFRQKLLFQLCNWQKCSVHRKHHQSYSFVDTQLRC